MIISSLVEEQVSGYPNDTLSINLSKDTCLRELLDIEGIKEEDYKLQNINTVFGKVNSIEYCVCMFNFPTLKELSKNLTIKE